MENKATIVFAEKELEMFIVRFANIRITYMTSYGSGEVDICHENGKTTLMVFTQQSFDDALRLVTERIAKANANVADFGGLLFTL